MQRPPRIAKVVAGAAVAAVSVVGLLLFARGGDDFRVLPAARDSTYGPGEVVDGFRVPDGSRLVGHVFSEEDGLRWLLLLVDVPDPFPVLGSLVDRAVAAYGGQPTPSFADGCVASRRNVRRAWRPSEWDEQSFDGLHCHVSVTGASGTSMGFVLLRTAFESHILVTLQGATPAARAVPAGQTRWLERPRARLPRLQKWTLPTTGESFVDLDDGSLEGEDTLPVRVVKGTELVAPPYGFTETISFRAVVRVTTAGLDAALEGYAEQVGCGGPDARRSERPSEHGGSVVTVEREVPLDGGGCVVAAYVPRDRHEPTYMTIRWYV